MNVADNFLDVKRIACKRIEGSLITIKQDYALKATPRPGCRGVILDTMHLFLFLDHEKRQLLA